TTTDPGQERIGPSQRPALVSRAAPAPRGGSYRHAPPSLVPLSAPSTEPVRCHTGRLAPCPLQPRHGVPIRVNRESAANRTKIFSSRCPPRRRQNFSRPPPAGSLPAPRDRILHGRRHNHAGTYVLRCRIIWEPAPLGKSNQSIWEIWRRLLLAQPHFSTTAGVSGLAGRADFSIPALVRGRRRGVNCRTSRLRRRAAWCRPGAH